ncbi:2'-5' RNA ligase family protein [Actinoplanes sp. GCM10030250]|uniref:2'-5' RNA ligase family protein n=1 Tax=Actinoplanes sp. GCM10030250 TaxID=3273376 RepID=UPI00360B7CBA
MKPFVFRHGSGLWPTGETLLHVYAVPDLDEDRALASLVAGCRKALDGSPLTFVADRWLHITVAQIADTYGRNYSAGDRRQLAAELERDLAAVEPFTLTVGSCLAQTSVVMFDTSPDDEINHLTRVVYDVLGRVRGPEALKYPAGIAHLTLGYANGEADSEGVQRALRQVRPSHAPMTVREVQLVDVTADPDAKTITWEPVARIPLGGR